MWATVWQSMALKKSVLFVCLGNICRSPACEGVCRSIVGGSIIVDSAGTCSYHTGNSPDERSQQVCRGKGIDISKQRARQIAPDDWTKFTVIAGLDSSVLSDLEYERPANATAKLVMFSPPAGVPDPYYGGSEGFEKMIQIITTAMRPFLTEHGLL
jgi:protein-tyrosine phosphatase